MWRFFFFFLISKLAPLCPMAIINTVMPVLLVISNLVQRLRLSWTTSMMQVKFFLYFLISIWKEDLMQLLIKSRFISKPFWRPNNTFFWSVLLFIRTFSPLLTFFLPNSPFFSGLTFLCQPHPPFWPHPPLTTSLPLAAFLPTPTSLSLAYFIYHCQRHLSLPTSWTITDFTFPSPRLLHSPTKRCSLVVSLNKTLNFSY